jgi:hypothetical protein
MNEFRSDGDSQAEPAIPAFGGFPESSPGVELAARTLVEERVRSLRRLLDRQLDPDDIVVRPTAAASRRHLFEEACDLYWNELNWEQLTDEERIADGELTEMVFPGLLALVDALLPRSENGEPDRDREHRDVAHDFLLWLAGRLVELRSTRPEDDEDRERIRTEIQVTDDLVDLVSCRLFCLTDEETGRIRGFGT